MTRATVATLTADVAALTACVAHLTMRLEKLEAVPSAPLLTPQQASVAHSFATQSIDDRKAARALEDAAWQARKAAAIAAAKASGKTVLMS